MPAGCDPGIERRRPITVVLVDDERLIRTALGQTLTSAGLDLIGAAASMRDAVEVVVDLRPDLVLMDIKLRDSPRVEAIERLSLLAPVSRILILTRTEGNRVVEAIVAGASGYILKTAPPKAIIAAVKATVAGEAVLCPQIAGKLLQRIRANATCPSPPPARTPPSPSVPPHRTRTRDLHQPRQRQEQSRGRPRALAQHPTPSPTTSPASSPNSTSRSASKQPSKQSAAASPDHTKPDARRIARAAIQDLLTS